MRSINVFKLVVFAAFLSFLLVLAVLAATGGKISIFTIEKPYKSSYRIGVSRETVPTVTVHSTATNPFGPDTTRASNSSVFPFMDQEQTWKDPFCDEFLSNKFSVKMTPCDTNSDRVLCYGSPYDDKMGSCFIHNVAMDPVTFYSIMKMKRDSVQTSNSLWLLRDNNINPCTNPIFDPMERYMAGGDYVKRLAKTSILSVPKGVCHHWINGTTFMFMGFDTHIYFKYLSWFSLHNGIINYENHSGKKPSLIIRIPETQGEFTHAEYEKNLFPETTIMSLSDFSVANDQTTCFEEIIVTPWAYSSTAFRCKMADAIHRLRNKCYNCNSRDLHGTRYLTFRKRALAACTINEMNPDPIKITDPPKKIVLQVRKAYTRNAKDSLTNFHRKLMNPKEIVDGLIKGFPNTTVEGMIAEDMSLCDQIKMAHNADVFIGVHGAGLVHLWWLQDHALLLEMVPSSQLSNPTFKMLSTLTGRQYYQYMGLKGSEMEVKVDVDDLVKKLKEHYNTLK